MSVCKKCGAKLQEGTTVCTVCGESVAQNDAHNKADDIKSSVSNILETPDHTNEFDANDIEANKIMALFSYLGILFLIPMFAAKDSPYAKFHANQGIILFIVSMACSVIGSVLTGILSLIPVLGWIMLIFVGLALGIVSLLLFALSVLGIVNAVTGKAKQLPLIGKYTILK